MLKNSEGDMGILEYLLLVTFYTPHLDNLTSSQIHLMNTSPYDGIAVAPLGAYNAEPVPDVEYYREKIELIRSKSEKDILPWVFLNRIVSRGRAHEGAPREGYFNRINGMDLDDEAGALSDLYSIWRLAAELAVELNSPGIVFDLELYNNYDVGSVKSLAAIREEDIDHVVERLLDIGKTLTDIVSESSPDLIIWFLFTDLDKMSTDAGSGKRFLFSARGYGESRKIVLLK